VTHLHIKWGVALGPIVVGADTRHLPHSRIHAHVVTLRYKARDEREARDIRTGLAAEPLVRFKSRSSGEPGQASRPLLVLIIQSTPVHCIPHEQIKRSTKPSLSFRRIHQSLVAEISQRTFPVLNAVMLSPTRTELFELGGTANRVLAAVEARRAAAGHKSPCPSVVCRPAYSHNTLQRHATNIGPQERYIDYETFRMPPLMSTRTIPLPNDGGSGVGICGTATV